MFDNFKRVSQLKSSTIINKMGGDGGVVLHSNIITKHKSKSKKYKVSRYNKLMCEPYLRNQNNY